MKTGYSVADCMTQNPLTVSKNISIKECAQLLKKNEIGSVLIVENKKPIGIITNQDLVFRAIAEGLNYSTKVSEIMSTDIIMISPDIDIFDAIKVMNENMIRHITVAQGNELVGYLTIKDILKIEPTLIDLYIDKIDLREEENKPITDFENEGICEFCGNYARKLHEFNNSKICSRCKKEEINK
jgi:signal-transduction protein with cAMP-binding, CBS, and nucleotidyltransferase domain